MTHDGHKLGLREAKVGYHVSTVNNTNYLVELFREYIEVLDLVTSTALESMRICSNFCCRFLNLVLFRLYLFMRIGATGKTSASLLRCASF